MISSGTQGRHLCCVQLAGQAGAVGESDQRKEGCGVKREHASKLPVSQEPVESEPAPFVSVSLLLFK